MKVIIKCTINMKTLQVIEEESHEYIGPLSLCGGSGGGSSGKVSYPDFMGNCLADWLDNTHTVTLNSCMNDVMNAALGNSPFIGESVYNPDVEVAAMLSASNNFKNYIEALNESLEWSNAYDAVVTKLDWDSWADAYAVVRGIIDWDGISDAEIVNDVAAFADQLDDEILTKVLPRFEAGMRDINAVVSSAFVIGRAIIEGMRDKDVAKHSSALRLNATNLNLESDMKKEELRSLATRNYLADQIAKKSTVLQGDEQILKVLLSKYAWKESYTKFAIEANRMKIVAKKEETDGNLELSESVATWDLELFQYGANLLASIGSGTMVPKEKKKNLAASAIGGGLTGAAAGAMYGASSSSITGPVGAAIGTIIGAGAGLLM